MYLFLFFFFLRVACFTYYFKAFGICPHNLLLFGSTLSKYMFLPKPFLLICPTETGSEDDGLLDLSEDDFFLSGSSSDEANADDEWTDKSTRYLHNCIKRLYAKEHFHFYIFLLEG